MGRVVSKSTFTQGLHNRLKQPVLQLSMIGKFEMNKSIQNRFGETKPIVMNCLIDSRLLPLGLYGARNCISIISFLKVPSQGNV